MSVGIRIKLGRRNSGHTNLLDQEPTQLEVPRSILDVIWEGVVCRNFDLLHIDEHEVTSLGVRKWQVKLLPNLIEEVHLAIHFFLCSLPEVLSIRLLKPHSSSFL